MPVTNAFTVDVEDYFQVSAFEHAISRSDWGHQEYRVQRSMDKLLELLEKHQVRATFFTLGWIAAQFPQIVKTISANGHEVASHGYWHKRAIDQARTEFHEDVSSTRKLLQDLSGQKVEGYRAPSFSVNRSNEWVYDVLAEEGYKYSSSIYPVVHDHYGVPDAPRFKYKTAQGLWEVPLSTLRFGSKNIPISGGGYFRLYPYRFSLWAIRRFNKVEGQPYVFYMHPWEIDPDQPRLRGLTYRTKFRHYLNLSKVEGRLNRLLADTTWGPMSSVLMGCD